MGINLQGRLLFQSENLARETFCSIGDEERKTMNFDRNLSGSCVVLKDRKVLLVKHTYGVAKDLFVIPGGFCEPGEVPAQSAKREVLEETQVKVTVGALLGVRFTTTEAWCIFEGIYEGGEPVPDGVENSEAVFMDIEEACESESVIQTTREILKACMREGKGILQKCSFVNPQFKDTSWQLFV